MCAVCVAEILDDLCPVCGNSLEKFPDQRKHLHRELCKLGINTFDFVKEKEESDGTSDFGQ